MLMPGIDFEVNKKPAEQNRYSTAECVINAIYAGTFNGSVLIKVLPEYQQVLGLAVWVCSNPETAARKRQAEVELVFTTEELKLVVETAMDGIEELRCLIDAKRMFGGVIGEAKEGNYEF
ncbi:hypothetical protein [Sporomusa acidovorans]|uniref:Uncharacterized protein n=1 Tax=Sporomusa acidovorans (strain ATCC 49682 / DSM 3132 / Mol) TaxID=1123286 RepID=A0ABZ3IWB3_SPOA4|nr:hypothetical protein [Sporomusa acidovorans]OZC23653.1 hypothetical protein SPACI_05550 [Sporomusa acidovorans DSM 3132]SDE24016.1 hypothetical protein SAMN04488499_101081 [Sporomusa acidovorans]